ncbi:insulinase family protein [Rhizobium gallicum]|uniref:insulinase family protein n=1 Tax=Rhizobium gallicum TaxID=56730 RepID=UPI001EF9898B|nr:insulinase family protein [Rhizobium gallicum]ULJ74549.1 insulinase family protein [Rhizobium gallicum]
MIHAGMSSLAQEIRVLYDLPQSRLRLAYSAISDKDSQFFAAYLMNHILGGGAFTSRLWNEVREKRGLAYGIGSTLVNNDHASALVIDTGTARIGPQRRSPSFAPR